MKRFYDITKQECVVAEDNSATDTLIISTDERVSVAFRTIDTIKYDRANDSDGFPIVLEYQLQDDGTRYGFYKELQEEVTVDDETAMMYVPDTEKIQALAVLKMIAAGEELVDNYVQVFIDEYNEANGVNFTSVDSCNKYVAQTDYSHQQFCIDIVAFNCIVWETARGLYEDGTITSETTEEDFIALLPVFGDDNE